MRYAIKTEYYYSAKIGDPQKKKEKLLGFSFYLQAFVVKTFETPKAIGWEVCR
jgi:hypothetical protein